MKNILIITLALFVYGSMNGQNIIEKHFKHLVEQEEATHVALTGKMFELFNSMDIQTDDEDMEELSSFISNVKSFELIAANHSSDSKSEYKKGVSKLGNEFEELLSITDPDANFTLFIDEDQGIVHELVGLGTHEEKMLVFSLLGEIQLSQIGKITSKVNSSDFKQLDQLQDLSIDKVKVYPNPAKCDRIVNVDLPKGFDEADLTLYDMSGNMVRSYLSTGRKSELEMNGVTPGNYVLHIEQGGVSLKKKLVVIK